MENLAKKYQMSESAIVIILLALGGGFRDAYSFKMRGGVFANAQTGNLVLFSESISRLDLHDCIKYILPILAFVIGTLLTDLVKNKYLENKGLHWRQIIVFLEFILLLAVGMMPNSLDHWANIIISFACAMQVESFRKFKGTTLATTMCTGNMRSGTEALSKFIRSRKNGKVDIEEKEKSNRYFFTIAMFCLGAGFGAISSGFIGIRAIWIDAFLMFIVFSLMFRKIESE